MQHELVQAFNTALQWHKKGKLKKAEALYKRILRADPRAADALANLGAISVARGADVQAERYFGKAVDANPAHLEAFVQFAMVYVRKRDCDSALAVTRRAVAAGHQDPRLYNIMGFALHDLHRFSEVIEVFERTLQLDARNYDAHQNIASIRVRQGDIHAAVQAYRRALSCYPADPNLTSALLLAQNYLPGLTDSDLYQEHVRFGRDLEAACPACASLPCDTRRAGRPLRIGYVSRDFRTHSVAFFFEPLLAAHADQGVEAYCYSDVESPDDTSGRLRQLAHAWHDTRPMSHEQVTELVRKDGIDVLVDLAGHVGRNRLPVFARRAAPVQVTYLGYPNTTGLNTMDYRLTDAWADPSGEEAYHTEQLARLQRCFLAYRPPADAPQVEGPPSSDTGRVTFGSFNNIAKVNEEVIALWSRVLQAVPDSRLLLKSKAFDDPPTLARYSALFARHGIGAERLELMGYAASQMGHLGLYARVDVALDTFPYNGTTTTCEALWMGVPVITLAGERHRARVGLSLLRAAGLPELVAESPDSYVARTVELANDQGRLSALRASLRKRLQASELLDGAGLARAVETAFRQIWQARKAAEKSVADGNGQDRHRALPGRHGQS